MIKYLYLILGICFGIIIQTVLIIVEAQTPIYCDKELFIYMLNNDLDNLTDCINAPDIMQDAKLEDLDRRIEIVENRTLINSTQVR